MIVFRPFPFPLPLISKVFSCVLQMTIVNILSQVVVEISLNLLLFWAASLPPPPAVWQCLAPKLNAPHRDIRIDLEVDTHQFRLHRSRSAADRQSKIVTRLDRQQTPSLCTAALLPSLSTTASAALVVLLVDYTKFGGTRHFLDGARPLSDKRAESGQRCSRPGHIIHYDLSAVQRHHATALRLRVRVARVVSRMRLLALPTLPHRVIDIGIVVHEGMRIRSHALVLTFRVLESDKKMD